MSTCWPAAKARCKPLVATLRTLLQAIYGMFKPDQLFDGEKV
jgi:hypothetical protein